MVWYFNGILKSMQLFSSFCVLLLNVSSFTSNPRSKNFERCNIPSQHQTVEYENSIKPGNISYLHVCEGSRARNLGEGFIISFLRTRIRRPSSQPNRVSFIWKCRPLRAILLPIFICEKPCDSINSLFGLCRVLYFVSAFFDRFVSFIIIHSGNRCTCIHTHNLFKMSTF